MNKNTVILNVIVLGIFIFLLWKMTWAALPFLISFFFGYALGSLRE